MCKGGHARVHAATYICMFLSRFICLEVHLIVSPEYLSLVFSPRGIRILSYRQLCFFLSCLHMLIGYILWLSSLKSVNPKF
jgi:hypothetical protein